MSIKTGKKLGFFGALTMMVGSVVGIGIFFKSHGVLRSNDWNGIGTLLAWILGGILSLSAAMSFSEIGSIKTRNVTGLPAYAEKLGGKTFGYFVRFNFTTFYYTVLLIVLAFFGSETIVGVIKIGGGRVDDVPIYGHALITIGILLFFITFNKISIKASGTFAAITTVLKWIPLVAVALLGIFLATTNNHPANGEAIGKGTLFGENAFNNGTSFSFTGMLSALPAVLFAYDSFLGTLSLKDKIKGGEKKLPLIVIVGMGATIVLYSLIAISAVLHGSGMVTGAPFNAKPIAGLGIFDQIFSSHVAKIMGDIVIVFIMISTFGVINAITAVYIVNMEQAIETNTIFGAKTLKQKIGKRKTSVLLMTIITTFWLAIVFTPALIFNTDALIDGASNFPTLFFFGIYAIVIATYYFKREELENRKIHNTVFKVFSLIAIFGILFVVIYEVLFGFMFESVIHPTKKTHWGLFVQNKVEVLTWQGTVLMGLYILLFLGLPALNYVLTGFFEKNDVIIDTQKLKKETPAKKPAAKKSTKKIVKPVIKNSK